MNHTEEKDYILSVLAQNHAGVLLRIAGLFSRRCYNIKSIVAAQTEDNNRIQNFNCCARGRPYCTAGR